MNSKTPSNLLVAGIIAKILTERLKQYGVTVSVSDVLDLFVGVAAFWHVAGPILARYFPNPTQPVIPAKE